MKLDIYMKSGNVVTVDWVKDWVVSAQGDRISEIKIVRYGIAKRLNLGRRLALVSLNLSQIEAVVQR